MVYFATQGPDGQLLGHREIVGPGETLVLRERGEEDDRRIWAVGEEVTESLFSEPCAGQQYDWGNGGWRRPYQGIRVIDPDRANVEAYSVKEEGDAVREAELTKAKVREARLAVQLAEESMRLASALVNPLMQQAREAGVELHDDASDRRPFREYGYLERLRVASDLINIMMRIREDLPAAREAFEGAVVAHRREVGVIASPIVRAEVSVDDALAIRDAEVAAETFGDDVAAAEVLVLSAADNTIAEENPTDAARTAVEDPDDDREQGSGEEHEEHDDEVDTDADDGGRGEDDERESAGPTETGLADESDDEHDTEDEGADETAPRRTRTIMIAGLPEDAARALADELS